LATTQNRQSNFFWFFHQGNVGILPAFINTTHEH